MCAQTTPPPTPGEEIRSIADRSAEHLIGDPELRDLLTVDADGAAAAVWVLLRTATDDSPEARDRRLFADTVAWVMAAPESLGIRKHLMQALYWVGWEVDDAGQGIPDEYVIEAAEVLAIDPEVTLPRLDEVMRDARDSEDAPEFLPTDAETIATVAALATVWLLDIAADDDGQDHRDLIGMCVAETSSAQGGCGPLPNLLPVRAAVSGDVGQS